MSSHFPLGESLSIAVPEGFASLIATVSDIALITDRRGKVLDIIWNLAHPADFDARALVGSRLEDLVTEESRSKIQNMLTVDAVPDQRRLREINHEIEGIGEFPMRYHVVPAGESVIFLGYEMHAVAALQSRLVEAQRALDADYGRLRQMETRYRVLFQTSSEALLILDALQMKILECNASASRLFGRDSSEVAGRRLDTLFRDSDQEIIREAVDRVAGTGQSAGFSARMSDAPVDLDARLAVFRAADATLMLCTLNAGTARVNGEPEIEEMLLGMVGRIPDAMILTDYEGTIRWCNDAFLGMAEIALAQQVHGEALSKFLGRPGVDMEIIIANAREHGRLRAFSSVLTGVFGSETRVEISVAALTEHEPPAIGFVMRDITRYDQIPARRSDRSEDQVAGMMHLVGSVPLKELVRASTEEIEKMCIETALKKTGNNRASAAELLGLSRQSLYVKLRRFGLLDSNGQ